MVLLLPKFQVFGLTAGFQVNGGGCQGRTDTTEIWNIIIEYALDSLVRHWDANKYGFKIDDMNPVNHLVWADNFFIVASSLVQLDEMVDSLTDALYAVQLEWKQTELKYIASSNVHTYTDIHILLPSMELTKFIAVSELECLGVMMDRRGSARRSKEHRMEKPTTCLV